MPIRAIVFDFDGVLADSEAVHEEAIAVAAQKLGLRVPRSDSDKPGRYVGLGDVEAFERVAAENGTQLSSDQMRRLIALKGEAFAARAHDGSVPAYPGSLELLREAARCDIPVAVCSGSHRGDIEPMLEGWDVLPLLQTLVSADDVPKTKPDPAPYLLTASRLNLDPSRCVAIEDSPAGIAAARAAGFRVHAVCHTFERARLCDAHHVHDRISELSLDVLLTR